MPPVESTPSGPPHKTAATNNPDFGVVADILASAVKETAEKTVLHHLESIVSPELEAIDTIRAAVSAMEDKLAELVNGLQQTGQRYTELANSIKNNEQLTRNAKDTSDEKITDIGERQTAMTGKLEQHTLLHNRTIAEFRTDLDLVKSSISKLENEFSSRQDQHTNIGEWISEIEHQLKKVAATTLSLKQSVVENEKLYQAGRSEMLGLHLDLRIIVNALQADFDKSKNRDTAPAPMDDADDATFGDIPSATSSAHNELFGETIGRGFINKYVEQQRAIHDAKKGGQGGFRMRNGGVSALEDDDNHMAGPSGHARGVAAGKRKADAYGVDGSVPSVKKARLSSSDL